MSVEELKNKVLKRLEEIDEAYIYEEILNLIKIENNRDEIFIIPDEHKEDLEISVAQKRTGNTIPNSEVKKRIESWLYR